MLKYTKKDFTIVISKKIHWKFSHISSFGVKCTIVVEFTVLVNNSCNVLSLMLCFAQTTFHTLAPLDVRERRQFVPKPASDPPSAPIQDNGNRTRR